MRISRFRRNKVLLCLVLLVGCAPASDSSRAVPADESADLAVPEVDVTDQNIESCYLNSQPKDPVEPGSAIESTFSFYKLLSESSTGTLSRGFELVALRIAEIAPYYDEDTFPPEELMTKLQGAILAVDLLCEKVFEGEPPRDANTTTTLPALDINGTAACNYIAEKIYFDPWGWDVYDIKADAEIDYGKSIGGRNYGLDSYLRRSFHKYIDIYEAAAAMTSNVFVSETFQTIADMLFLYTETHDPIPYPDFEDAFDRRVISAVNSSRQVCNTFVASSSTIGATTTSVLQSSAAISPTTTRATMAPMTTTLRTTTTVANFPPTLETDSMNRSSITLQSNANSNAVYWTVRVRDPFGGRLLSSPVVARLCPVSSAWPDGTGCTSATSIGTGNNVDQTYTFLFLIAPNAPLGQWIPRMFGPVSGQPDIIGDARIFVIASITSTTTTLRPTTTIASTTSTSNQPTLDSDSMNRSSITLQSNINSNAVYWTVRVRDPFGGRLSGSQVGARLCPVSSTWPDGTGCTGATSTGTGNNVDQTYTFLFLIAPNAPLGQWVPRMFGPVSGQPDIIGNARISVGQ